MPSLFNTVGNLEFYNFISNQLPSGVLCADTPTYEATNGTLIRWLGERGLSTTTARFYNGVNNANDSTYNSSNYIYFYFPQVVGEPCENEIITTSANSSNRWRFQLRLAYDPRAIGIDNDQQIFLQSTSLTTTSRSITENLQTRAGTTNNTSRYCDGRGDWFSFAVASPSTVIMTTFNTSTDTNPSLNADYEWNQTVIMGWAQDSIYPSPPTVESFRHNACYYMILENDSKTNAYYSYLNGRRINTVDADVNNQGFKLLDIKYYDISCQSGSYVAGTFVTDLLLFDEVGQEFGRADNRVICLGRGAFEKGRIYQLSNVFGRTGAEEWICVGAYTPNSYALGTWLPGQSLPSAWSPNEYDYMLMRIYTEAD